MNRRTFFGLVAALATLPDVPMTKRWRRVGGSPYIIKSLGRRASIISCHISESTISIRPGGVLQGHFTFYRDMTIYHGGDVTRIPKGRSLCGTLRGRKEGTECEDAYAEIRRVGTVSDVV